MFGCLVECADLYRKISSLIAVSFKKNTSIDTALVSIVGICTTGTLDMIGEVDRDRVEIVGVVGRMVVAYLKVIDKATCFYSIGIDVVIDQNCFEVCLSHLLFVLLYHLIFYF